MCGRYTHHFRDDELTIALGVALGFGVYSEKGIKPNYNVAPTQFAPVVRQDAEGKRTADFLRWGLVPFWADDQKVGSRMINAQSETAATKPAFRDAFKRRRCLVPADGFYEWQALEGSKTKQPWYFSVKGAPLFCFAGLWERWDKEGEPVETFTILTGKPNELVAPIHNRMPVIVPPELYGLWLDGKIQTASELASAMEPFPADRMQAIKVSRRVNSPKNNDPSLVEEEPG